MTEILDIALVALARDYIAADDTAELDTLAAKFLDAIEPGQQTAALRWLAREAIQDRALTIAAAGRADLTVPGAAMYVRCADCGHLVDHIRFGWYPMPDDTSLCHLCGPNRGLAGLVPAEQG
jgi:hypothetical protein